MDKLTFCAPCMFGLESVLSGEIRRMGAEIVEATDGRIFFSGDLTTLIEANLWLRTAERVMIVVGSFKAMSFTELFDGVRALPFEDFIGVRDAFPVKGYSINSALFSIPDCQSIIKKAVVERLKERYKVSWFEETGSLFQLRFSIFKDNVHIMIDTSEIGRAHV